LHMVQLMSLPLIVSCFSKIHISFTFLVLACPGSPGKTAVKCVWVCVCVCVCVCVSAHIRFIYYYRNTIYCDACCECCIMSAEHVY